MCDAVEMDNVAELRLEVEMGRAAELRSVELGEAEELRMVVELGEAAVLRYAEKTCGCGV